jgi:hypothetical protein
MVSTLFDGRIIVDVNKDMGAERMSSRSADHQMLEPLPGKSASKAVLKLGLRALGDIVEVGFM